MGPRRVMYSSQVSCMASLMSVSQSGIKLYLIKKLKKSRKLKIGVK